MVKGIMTITILIFILLLSGVSPEVLGNDTQDKGCLQCHQGIDFIGLGHEDISCEGCHQGDPEGATKEVAHAGLYGNPGDLNIAQKTCGECHEDNVSRIKKSLHASMAGMISGARYLWSAQKEKNAIYAVRPVEDEDGNIPKDLGALETLQQIPHYKDSKQPIDDYLRNQCLRCHLWTEGAKRAGDYRSSGCSACHVLYADDGLSRSGDKTIPKDKPGHLLRHGITTKIPAQQCVHCHNRGGRAGVSFLGMMESDGYGTPFRTDGTKQPKLHGKHYNYLQKDLHYEAGLHCIDCHTSNDIHGDGNIYSKRKQAVEIECTDCHGNTERYSDLKTSRGNPLTNLQRQNEDVVLKGRMDGKLHRVIQVRTLLERGVLPGAMSIEGHMKKLECYACHSRWAPQCYGCHAKMDMRQKGYDWVDGSKEATYGWQESRSYLRWETPTLGINPEGKVSPFITGCQAIFTRIGEAGKAKESNKVYVTSHGHLGIAHNPVQPHTISRKARTCEDCHSNPKALGLGSGHYISQFNGIDIPSELERIVDEDGNQIQATSHVGARPFNKEEQQKIKRINVCLACHQEGDSTFWRNVKEKWGEAKDNQIHRDILKGILRKATDK